MNLVVDASVAIKWLVAESGHEHAAALLLNFPLLRAPDFLEIEVANVLWKKVRRRELDAKQARLAFASLPRFFESLSPSRELVERAMQISLEIDHPVYDCIYLAAAEKELGKLATADARLADKCARTAYGWRVLLVDRFIGPEELALTATNVS